MLATPICTGSKPTVCLASGLPVHLYRNTKQLLLYKPVYESHFLGNYSSIRNYYSIP
jgi:hypothetical protein